MLVASAMGSAILSIVIAGGLTYLSNEYKLNVRSHVWNQTMHLAEAAVELGFAELNYQHFRGGTGFDSSRGWLPYGNGGYVKFVRDFTDAAGKVVGDITVVVSAVDSSSPWIFGTGITGTGTAQTIGRGLQVVALPSTRFPVGLMSKERLDLNGKNIYTDSFDSSDPAKSSGGMYDANKRQANGDVASNDVLVNSVNIGNASVYGRVFTGVRGTVAIGPNGSVGPTFEEAARARSVAAGEQAGWIRHDFDVDVPDATAPQGATGWTSVGKIHDTTLLTDGDWRTPSINLQSNEKLTIQGKVRLYVTGNVSVSGNASIEILPASVLEVYVAGSVSVSGNGIINNTGLAINNQWYGLPSSTSWSVSGNGRWIGTIFAPQASFWLNGGGANGDMSGAVVARKIDLDGNVRFHYDEQLGKADKGAGYKVGSWNSFKLAGGQWVVE